MIYFLRHIDTGLIKIGCTNTFKERYSRLKGEFGALEILGFVAGFEDYETQLHNQFQSCHVTGVLRGEEWFKPDAKLLKFISDYASEQKPLPIGTRRKGRKPSRVKKTIKQIPVSDEVRDMIKDMAYGANVTMNDLLEYLMWSVAGVTTDMPRMEVFEKALAFKSQLKERSA